LYHRIFGIRNLGSIRLFIRTMVWKLPFRLRTPTVDGRMLQARHLQLVRHGNTISVRHLAATIGWNLRQPPPVFRVWLLNFRRST